MKLKPILTVILLFTLGFCSCNFDTLENERIVGNYWIITIDLPENRALGYSNHDDGSYKEIIVPHTVKKIEWNDDYLLVSRNPNEDIKNTYLEIIGSTIREREIKRLNLTPNIDLALDSVFNDRIDNLAKKELIRRMKNDLQFLENPKSSDLIIWYLIDKNEKSSTKVFLTKDLLMNYIDSLGIKSFEKAKVYK